MADDYELGTVGPIPTVNPNVAKIGEMLKIAKKYADQYYVKDYVPLIGGTTLGEFLLGKAPEEIERWGQGDYPVRNPNEVVGTGGNRLDVWKAGRFEPTFDVATNVVAPLAGAVKVTKGMPVGASIMGPESKLWKPEMAFQAGKMEAKGAKADEILEATGMVRGLDNQWRSELSDQFAKMKQKGDMFSEQYMAAKDIDPIQVHLIKAEEAKYGKSPPDVWKMNNEEYEDYFKFRQEKIDEHNALQKAPVKVKDMLDHPQLFEAYPHLGEIKVQVGSGHGGQRGSYNDAQKTITLAGHLSPEEARSTLLHELTHGIQAKEGFNRGGNPDMFTHQKLAQELKQNLEIRGVADVVKKGMPNGTEDEILAKLENIYKNKGFDQEYIKKALDRDYWTDEIAQKIVKDYGLDTGRAFPYTKEEMYKNLAGEAEARMVQNRLDLSPEELRQKFPYQYAPKNHGLDIDPDVANVISDRGQLINEPSQSIDFSKIPTKEEYEAMVGKGQMRQARTFEQDLEDTLTGKVPGNKFDIPMEHSYDYESGDFTKRLKDAGLHVYDDKYGTVFVGKTPKDLEVMKNADTPIEHGLSYGYTPEDIAKFYTNRRGGRSDIGYSEYLDDLKYVQNKYAPIEESVDYRGAHKAPRNDDYHAPAHDLTTGGMYSDDIYSSRGHHYYGTGNNKMDRETLAILNEARNNPDHPITIYRAVPSEFKDQDINPGDWVTPSLDYAHQHGLYFDSHHIIEKTVPAKHIYTNADSIHEFGYDPTE